ncbi:MAG TPA: hypothetical protein VMV92_16860 [Streptosporangiaceae bacterium]|nr:hypothetical protein [Streptosporangiaceae bacterium]
MAALLNEWDPHKSVSDDDRGGWLSGPSLPEDDVMLAELRAQHPQWTIWKGKHTGSWWACPPPGVLSLIDAPDLGQLEAKILDIEAWETGQ